MKQQIKKEGKKNDGLNNLTWKKNHPCKTFYKEKQQKKSKKLQKKIKEINNQHKKQ